MESRQSVAGVAYRNDGSVLIMHRLPGGSAGKLWEFPGGKVKSNESPKEALIREWMEETGINIRVGKELVQGQFKHRKAVVLLTAYEVLLPSNDVIPKLIEHDDYRWVKSGILDAFELVDSDRIVAKVLY